MNKKVIVCGGREYWNKSRVYQVLDEWIKMNPDTTIISGGAKGADTLAIKWARERAVKCDVFPAKWKVYGNSAGILRNIEMLDQVPFAVIAFPGGTGTAHMVKIAKKASVMVFEIDAG